MADYEAERQRNIQSNRDLLLSLGLDQLQNFGPAAVANPPKVPKPVKKAAKKPKPAPPKRKIEEVEAEKETEVKETKAARVDDDNGGGMRRSTRRAATKVVDYNEDRIVVKKEKEASDAKLRSKELGEDRHGRQGNRLGVRKHDPKQFGAIPGIEPGMWWETRAQCSNDAIHAPFVAGIAGNAHEGAYSVALSGGYDDDVDLGYAFTYTGCGGRDLKGTKDAPKNLRTAPQSSDQTFDNSLNMALKISSETRKPVRVIRGYKLKSIYAPKTGYRYDGLYIVEKAWTDRGLNPGGFKVVKFAFKRMQDQPPIPERSDDSSDEEEADEEDAEEKDTSPSGPNSDTEAPPTTASTP